MRNILKPAARTASSRSRRSVRGVAAVVASFALAAGLGSYPVDAQETAAVSETASVQATRIGDVDVITINDSDGEAWGYGAKASLEDIFGIKRSGEGEIEEIVSLTVDGKKLAPEFYGFTNNAGGGYIAFDLDALNEVPPKLVEVEARTTGAATYSIAESDAVPTARELSPSGYGQNANAAASTNPTGVGMARATDETKWSEEVQLSSPIVGTGKERFDNIGTEPYFKVRPTGELPNQVGEDIRITRIVVRNTENNSRNADDEAVVLLNDGADGQHYFRSPTQVRDDRNRVKGFEAVFFNPETGDSPVADEFIIQSGQDSLKIGVDGVDAWDSDLDTLRSRYVVEVYGSFRVPVGPSTAPAPTSAATPTSGPTAPADPSSPAEPTRGDQPQPSTSSVPLDDETKRFDMEGRGGIRLNPATTTGESPYETTATVDGSSTFSKAVVRINAPNSILATEAYSFNLDKTETGVSFERRVVSTSSDYVEFEVYPVKNGQRVDSVQVPNGAKFTMTSNFSDNPESIDAVATIHGTSLVEPKEPVKVSPPDGADWVEKQYPNPEMPKKCGLKVAIVADQSRSLNYGDENGFKSTRDATTAMVEALRSAPGTEVGLYTFGRTATSSTGGPVPLEVNGQVNPTITNAIDGWTTAKNGDATNWEAALNAVMGQRYDVVYFITDGMPTFDEDGWQNRGGTPAGAPYDYAGAFVQERSLNRAILAANKLKEAGTRIVPIQVDLTLRAGNVVTRDYVLKNIYSYSSGAPIPRGTLVSMQNRPRYDGKDVFDNWENAVYPNTEIIVNVEQAVNSTHKTNNKVHLMDIIELGDYNAIHTTDMEEWTYGTREVKQMGEDISGPGDTVHIENYSALAAQLEAIAQEVARLCHGKIIVQKQIVDANGKVLTDGAEGWGFSVMANSPIIDAGNDDLVYADSKTTANEEGADKPQASWNLVTDNPATATITEHQQEGYKLYQRDEKNAVCTQNLNGEKSPLEVQNTGATGFRVPVNTSGSHVATVVCVVANTKADQPNFGLEVKKVDLDDRNTTLSEAQFEVREVAAAEGEAPQTWDLEPGTEAGTYTLDTVLEPGKEYDLVEVKAPTQDGVVYSLLTAPVRFRGTVQDQGVAVEYESDGKWVSDISTQGVWSVVSDKQTAYLEVANVRQGNMPKTGGAGLQLPILFGGALIAAGALLGRRKVAA
ncbi:LPXTG cell wall anchor domain-containing protein [Corynebacterium lujinxingii]|uniref:LPXTG cell wall anchor domain-containing protein n=1 Tax=Corynebacterium lujinxingii TaxID=2763010 RepID=A0A7H0JY61_9CORY|nr:LPXTG cell wall anchor domain-containing protein [Corynebacterium lujinxingii]MBC3178326.1 LPXTG cell wall anchor domain-containing protein [Corynebacterium lujinxingii]NNO10797.1 LPXTG cell wall anchor domain-containing protein [Corynebacterium lujinxingii]QNP89977.1 LPXTG cell wall anchor domain-containing protein [Corynebacterium lujinxingii]